MLIDDTSDCNLVTGEGKIETEGKTETDGGRPKEKEKKYRSAPPTKVVIRRLPPTMTLEKFIDQVSPLPENDYLYFAKADASLGQYSFCTAYVNFVDPKDVFIFKEKFDDYIFIDNKGNEFPAVVEFAPFQKIPRKKSRQRDPKCGTIDTDPDYLAFVTQMKQTVEETPDIGIKSTCGKSSPLSSVQDVLEEIEAKERDRKCRKATTPLIEFIKQRKMERQRMKDEKKEERKRREVERKRAKEEERKHRREANREAIQGKRDRKEQRREGGTRHEDRLGSKHDLVHASKASSENCQSPPPGGGDGTTQKKDIDFSFDDADDDEEDEVADEDEEDADQDIYDQEQTQKLKEILRIGTVCKGSEKVSHGEYSSDLDVSNVKKGTEKGHVGSHERNRGGGDWERGNRSQRISGSYSEEYHGARPKLNRSDGGGHERRGGTKEKKQNDQRQFAESRHRDKPGKVWLAKNEARHQKQCEERIRIQKSDGDRVSRDEPLVDKNVSHVKDENGSEMDVKASSPVSEELGQPPPSSQDTTPSSEVEDLVEVGQSERKGGKEGLSEKSNPESEGRHKNSVSAKGSRDTVSSFNQNATNGEMRRMRNKVGTSRDSGSLKMIKNKDRPSIEIYRPGMRRFNLQKKEATETGGTTKQSGNVSATNMDLTGETISPSLGSGYSGMHGTSGNPKGKERDDKRRIGGGRGGGNKRRDGSWKQGEDTNGVRHERHKGRDERGRGNWGGQGEPIKSSDGVSRDRYDDKTMKEDLVEVRSMTFKRSVSRD